MKKYTIGIYFDYYLSKVALILKNRPDWQAGKYNFPGGHIEENENAIDCVIREFKEECGITTTIEDWRHIGRIQNQGFYECEIFTAYQDDKHGEVKTMEDEVIRWWEIDNLPENIITNLSWLIPYAVNYWHNGNNIDHIKFSVFEYEFEDRILNSFN